MKTPTDTFLYVAGCTGTCPASSEPRPVWDPSEPDCLRRVPFPRVRYGQHTTCFFLRYKDTYIIADHGFGIHPASYLLQDFIALQQSGSMDAITDVHCVQSHYHTDHIHGFTRDTGFYNSHLHFQFWGPDLTAARGLEDVRIDTPLTGVLIDRYFRLARKDSLVELFPVSLDKLRAKHTHRMFTPGDALTLGGITTRTHMLRHSGGSCGFRFEVPGVGGVVVATDFEPEVEPEPAFVEFINGARLLLIDMQYRDTEYAGEMSIFRQKLPRNGWGHGTPRRVFAQILACTQPPAMVRIVHHDPDKTDDELDAFQTHSREVLQGMTGKSHPPFDYAFALATDIYWL